MKKFFICIILLFISSIAYAAQCPSTSDLIHKIDPNLGYLWFLSEQAQADGWYMFNQKLLVSTIPSSYPLGVLIDIDYGVRCTYGAGNHSVMVVNYKRVDPEHLSIPPFQKNKTYPDYAYDCNSTAGNPERCQWNWL